MKVKNNIYRNYIKRVIDFLLSLLAIIIFSPVFVVIGVLVKIKLGSPIIYKQKRPGLNGKVFTIYKFRTMTDEKDDKGNLLPDGLRLTSFGKLLRSTSLDELPELFNIVRGEMSIVGPRPLLVQYLPLYNDRQKRRHEVRPGLTGLAQINGRNSLTWEDKFEYDVKYVDTLSFFGDIKIFLNTLKKVIIREGISSNSASTMEPFTGN